MFFRLFNWLLKRVPYTLAISIPNTLWAIITAVFGFFLIFARADFEATGTGEIFIYAVSLSVAAATLLVFLEFGVLRLLGIKKWERREVRVINDNVLNGHIRPDVAGQTILKIYNAFGKIHKWLMYRNIQYTSAVVIICALAEWLASDQLKNIPVILAGGLIAICISFICTIPLYELLFSPVRRECKMLLAKRGIHFKEPPFLSLEIKSKFFIILIALTLGTILILIPSLSLIPIIFFIIILLITGILSKLIFESIHKAFMEVRESARDLEQGKRASFFSGSLDKELLDLSKSLNVAANEIYNIKNTLEIQIKARVEALEEERTSLAQKVEERTRELQERIEELERFYKITIGRELKMVELKKEIKELKEKLENQEKNKK